MFWIASRYRSAPLLLFLLLASLFCCGCDRQRAEQAASNPARSAASTAGSAAEVNAEVPGRSTPGGRTDPLNGLQELRPVAMQAQPFSMPGVDNPGYVGPEECGECHRGRLDECLPTSHFQTCRPPTDAKLPRGFRSLDAAAFQLPDSHIRFVNRRDGEQLIQSAIDLSRPSQPQTDSTIDLILGAGKSSDEVYLSWHADNTLWELPIAWVYATDSWGASGFNRHASGDFARELTVRCFECHNTWFEHVPGTLAEYKPEGLITGVTCERCHGPAREHVEYHRLHPDEETSQHILLPSDLPRERLIEVCTQCHGNYIRHRGAALSYRPGEVLEDHYRLVDPKYDEDDHVVNQIEYMRQSKCFQASDMSCITCHDPHLTDQPANGLNFDIDCRSCHQPEHCGAQPDLPEPVRSSCTSCHMRKYVKINVNFDLEDDLYVPPTLRSQHRIEVDPIATQETLYRWYREQAANGTTVEALAQAEWNAKADELGQQLVQHWRDEAASRNAIGRYRGAVAAIREALLIEPESDELRQLLTTYTAAQRALDDDVAAGEHAMSSGDDRRASEFFRRVIDRQPDNALLIGKLGTLLAKQGNRSEAERLLERVVELNPDEQYGLTMLAWLSLLDGDFRRASELYERADSIEPFNAKLLQLWGQALMRGGQPEQALERFRQSLKSDPRQLDALRGAALTAAQLSDFSSATDMMTQAVQLGEYRNVADIKTLAELYAELRDQDMIRQLAQHLLTLVDASQHADVQAWARSLIAN